MEDGPCVSTTCKTVEEEGSFFGMAVGSKAYQTVTPVHTYLSCTILHFPWTEISTEASQKYAKYEEDQTVLYK